MCIRDRVYDKPNEYLYELKQSCPDRIVQFYWANPKDPNIMSELEAHLPLWNYSGVKLHQIFSSFDTNQESMHQIAEFCEAHNLPLFIHMFKRNNIIEFIDLLQQHPHTKFIVGHMIGYELIEERVFHLDNYWFDISPFFLVSDKRVRKALASYGAGRLCLGSDIPFGKNGLEKNMARVRALPIPQNDIDLIMGGNMQELLGL
jgi:predicted TIM-barrel fold metal-dependent hydrolase